MLTYEQSEPFTFEEYVLSYTYGIPFPDEGQYMLPLKVTHITIVVKKGTTIVIFEWFVCSSHHQCGVDVVLQPFKIIVMGMDGWGTDTDRD